MTADNTDRPRQRSPRRRVIAVPADIAPPTVDEISLEAFNDLLVELTGRRAEPAPAPRVPR